MIFPIQVDFVCWEFSSIAEITPGNEFFMNISHLLAISPLPVKKLTSKVDLHSELTGERRRPISILNITVAIQTSLSKITPSNCLCWENFFSPLLVQG